MAILVGSRVRGFAGRRFLCLSHSRPPREREFLSAQSPTRASVRGAFPRSGSTGRAALREKGDLHFQFSRCFRWTSLARGSSKLLSEPKSRIDRSNRVGRKHDTCQLSPVPFHPLLYGKTFKL